MIFLYVFSIITTDGGSHEARIAIPTDMGSHEARMAMPTDMGSEMYRVMFEPTRRVVYLPIEEVLGYVGNSMFAKRVHQTTGVPMYAKRLMHVVDVLLSQGCAIERFICASDGVWSVVFQIETKMKTLETLVVGMYISALETEDVRGRILDVLHDAKKLYCSIEQLVVPNQVNDTAEKKRAAKNAAYRRRMLRKHMVGDLKAAEVLMDMLQKGNLTRDEALLFVDIHLYIEKKALCFCAD